MTTYLANAFSLNMLDLSTPHTILTLPRSMEVMKARLSTTPFQSAIGHAATAQVLSTLLEVTVTCERTTVHLEEGDTLYVAQITGQRLEEGKIYTHEEVRLLSIAFVEVLLVEGAMNT